ncbi:M28 family peptidase [Pyxidicoccus sp. 3LG]
MSRSRLSCSLAVLSLALTSPMLAGAEEASPAARERYASLLVGAMLGGTPMVEDLRSLVDEVGGRATGSESNRRSVEWALERFRAAGVTARAEPFRMPALWLEQGASATVQGKGLRFTPRVAAMPFSTATPKGGLTAPLLDAGRATEADFTRLGAKAKGAFLLVETDELRDVDGLFREYNEAVGIEARAFASGAAGVVYMGSRPGNQLYRHSVSVGAKNTRPMMVMERDGAKRAQRLLRAGSSLNLTAMLDLRTGGPYEAKNVIGEIRGTTRPDEVVVLGAHLDSWDLGGGALDNGANVAMLIDLARQMQRLGLKPARTLRFALWNGEEQGMHGSAGYVRSHAAELDGHAVRLTLTGRGPLHRELTRPGALAQVETDLRERLSRLHPPVLLESLRDGTRPELDLEAVRAEGGFARTLLDEARFLAESPEELARLWEQEALGSLGQRLKRLGVDVLEAPRPEWVVGAGLHGVESLHEEDAS